MGQIPPALTWAQLQATAPGATVNVVISVTDQPAPDLLIGTFLEADEAEPFSAFRPTAQQIQIRFVPAATPIIMGESADLHTGALLRVHGSLEAGPLVVAQQLVILTRVGKIIP